jgi:hypothetical protein
MRLVANHYESADLDAGINIFHNKFELNTSMLSMLNIPTTIIMYNVGLNRPVILRNGTNCTDCATLSYASNTFTFTVPHFTTYEIVEGSPQCNNNGKIDSGEQCDGTNITGTCLSLGYSNGTLSCNSDCTVKTTSCFYTQPSSSPGGSPDGSTVPSTPTSPSCISSAEVCDNADNNCNGLVDDGITCQCIIGQSKHCGSNIGQCRNGTMHCDSEGVWGQCAGSINPAIELCDDSIDNDCNGVIDDNCTTAELAQCKDGPVPETGCFMGAAFYTEGYVANGIHYAEKPKDFPWLLLTFLGGILLCVLLAELAYHSWRSEKAEVAELIEKYGNRSGK